jgi:hypothetical protein
MGERDGKKPTPVTNGHMPAGNGAATPGVQPSVGGPRNRLPPPRRSRPARIVVAAHAAQGPDTQRRADFDEATLIDGASAVSQPPQCETFEAPRRRRELEHTQIVIPLPPPELPRRARLGSPADPLAQTAGEIVCSDGRSRRARAPRAAVVIEGDRRRGLALGLAIGIAAIAGAAIGFSAISSPGLPRVVAPGPANPARAARVEEAALAPRQPVVEQLPVAAREPEAAPAEAPTARDEAPPPRVERTPVARPLRQRTIAPSSSIGRHKTGQPARASKRARSRALSYDPDALFLKRP